MYWIPVLIALIYSLEAGLSGGKRGELPCEESRFDLNLSGKDRSINSARRVQVNQNAFEIETH
jgi:hypothetical protein